MKTRVAVAFEGKEPPGLIGVGINSERDKSNTL